MDKTEIDISDNQTIQNFRKKILVDTKGSKPINFYQLFKKFFIPDENKLDFKKYLMELFYDLSYQSSEDNKGISKETFFFLFSSPVPIIDHLFKNLDKDKDDYLNLEEFLFGIYDIYGNNTFIKLARFVFDLYDYNKDGLIDKQDVKLFLSYVNVENNLKQKIMQKDFINIEYEDIALNQRLIDEIINKVFTSNIKNVLDFDNFVFIIENKCSDIFVSVLIYLHEIKFFNNEVIKLYSNSNYDYLMSNKNSSNFKSIANLFKTKKKSSIINDVILNNTQKLEMPVICVKNSLFYNPFEKNRSSRSLNQYHDQFLNRFKNENLSKFFFGKNIIMKDNSRNNSFERKTTKNLDMNLNTLINEFNIRTKANYKLIKEDKNSNNKMYISDLSNKKIFKTEENYEGYVFKITKESKLKVYYMKLIKNDLFYYKSKDQKFHNGMHHLTKNIVIFENKPKKFKTVNFFSFTLLNEVDKHTFYFDKEDKYIEWLKHLQKALLFRKIEDYYTFGEGIKKNSMRIIKNIKMKNKDDELICTQIIRPKNCLIKKHNESIFNQVSAIAICHHPNLCKMYDFFEDEKYLYIITEKCTGTNVLEYFKTANIHNPYEEEIKICEIIHQLLMAVYYLHNFGIVHRNIKPDNVLMTNNKKNSSIKLVDLSLSKYLNNKEKTKEPYGTVGYSSPEMLQELPYDKKIDEWSIGVLTYLLLCGKLPFSDEHSEREIARQTIHEQLKFTQPIWEQKSRESKDFVKKLLIKDPAKRMTVKEALTHNWIKKYFPKLVEKRINEKNKFENNSFINDFTSFENYTLSVNNNKKH